MAASLTELINPVCIELDLKEKRKPDLIRELAEVLARTGEIDDVDSLTGEILKREKISSTGIGSGIAIPHCLTKQVSRTYIAFGRKLEGARFEAVDNQPVALFFLLVGPEGDHARHLQVLSRIARYLHDPNFRQQLLSAQSPDEVLAAISAREAG